MILKYYEKHFRYKIDYPTKQGNRDFEHNIIIRRPKIKMKEYYTGMWIKFGLRVRKEY